MQPHSIFTITIFWICPFIIQEHPSIPLLIFYPTHYINLCMYVYIYACVYRRDNVCMYDFIQKQMKMAATLEEFPTSPSFAMRDNAHFPRSISTKEPPISDPPCLPPRLSSTTAASLSLSLHQYSQPTTPRISFSPEYSSKMDTACAGTYRCVSSVLKKDGQILCIAAANGLVYTGSQGNVVRVWKLPEFTECGQLKTKTSMVVALQVSNDRVYAAYADCRIRVWRRTWEGVIRHVRMATVPTAGSYVRSYIVGGNKMVIICAILIITYIATSIFEPRDSIYIKLQ